MTLILGVRYEGNAYVMADRRMMLGSTRFVSIRENGIGGKLWRCGKWVVGFAGSDVHKQSVARAVASVSATPEGVYELADAILESVAKRAELVDKLDGKSKDDGTHMIDVVAACGDKVWEIDCVGGVSETESPIVAVGSGQQYALGAMTALLDLRLWDRPRGISGDKLVGYMALACRAASEHCQSVGGPFDWLSTDGTGGVFR